MNYIFIQPNPMHLLLLVALVWGSVCGRIRKGDIWVDYANAGSMTEIAFSFMLENAINQQDYIKVAFPFPLHANIVPAYPATEGLSLPSGLYVTYQLVDQSSNIQPTVFTCQALTETIDSSNYFIRFYAADRKTFVPIPKNQWYYLKFKIQQTEPLTYQKSSTILQIQISTVSSTWSNAMVYDDNLAFNYFQLAPAPSQTITLATTPYGTVAGGFLLTEAVYSMYLDVTINIPTYQFQENLKLVFSISQDRTFKWAGACSSVAKTNAPRISMLNASLYTCTVDTVKNLMVVLLTPAALAIQTSYRFTVQVTNPPIVITGVDIIVRATKQVSGAILSFGTSRSALNTNQIYITYQQIFVGWGLRPDALLPFDARIFRGNADTPTYMPYNSLTTRFKISQSTSTTTQLRIQISIPSEQGAFVLSTGYTHNLPSFPNKQVRCVVEFATDTLKRRIACTGVGSLNSATEYYIGWRMFFPYANYEQDIDCTKFGLLTIYTAEMINERDNVFILGRGDAFLNFMKNSPDYYVIGRNSSYIAYMRTLGNVNMMVLSSDFQEFLSTPQLVIVNNRPDSFPNKIYNDVYVVTQNLAFMTYLQLFDDLYIAYRLKSASDITKSYRSTPLVATSMPKNTLAIKTSNSKDWTNFVANTNPLVSSSLQTTSLTPTQGLRMMAGNQTIFFNLQAAYAEVTSTLSSSTNVVNNWGMYIMMSPKIKLAGSTVTLKQSAASLSAEAVTIDDASAYNKYTLITLRGTTTASLQTSFPITATKTVFSLSPFLINDYSSIYGDDNNFDIMIATVDGIDGPLDGPIYKLKFNSFFLINAFTMINSAEVLTLNSGFVAYSHAAQLTGASIPTMLRVKGTLPATPNFQSLNIFFDSLTPFFSNFYNGDIYCKTTEASSRCRYQQGTGMLTTYEYLNYHTYSRIEIKLGTPTTAFDVLIPIKAAQGKVATYYHIGYTTKDPTTGKLQLVYISPRKMVTHSGTATASGQYGPVLTSLNLGQNVTNLGLRAALATAIAVNSGNNVGGAFLYFSEWDYFSLAATPTWSNGPCYTLSYLLYSTNYDAYIVNGTAFTSTYKNMVGVACFTDTGNSVSAAQLTISSSRLPTRWGLNLPGTGGYSQNVGNLVDLKTNNMAMSSSLTIAPADITSPSMGPLLDMAVGKWVIKLPVAIDSSIKIVIYGNSGANLPFISPSGTCATYVGSKKMPIGCIFSISATRLDYTLTIKQSDLLPKDTNLEIYHYGMKTNSSNNAMAFNFSCYSLWNTNSPGANDLIFYAASDQFLYGATDPTYISPSLISLGSFLQVSNNKAAITRFNFSFSLLGKGLYVTNRVRVDLGQYAIDNMASQISPICKIYTYTVTGSPEYSHDWAAIVTTSGFSQLDFWPETDLVNNNLTYTVVCNNFAATSTSSPASILARVVNDSTSEISTQGANQITLSTLANLPKTNQMSATKRFILPSTFMEIDFSVGSPGVTTDSILYIGFPTYYASGLGPDIKCYSTNEIWCKVTDRELKIRYIGTFPEGSNFVVTVTGVEQPVNYNSGTFYFVIDDDDNPTTVLSSGTFIDSVRASVLDTQNFPAFQILSFSQSSLYLREEQITLTLTFYVPPTLSRVTVGQSLFLVFPTNFQDVLRFVSPTCTLNIRGNTLKNYISSCTVRGLRLRMPFLDDMTLGSVYALTVAGLINPTNPSSSTFKYALEITGSSGTSIIARTFSPHANFEMPIFVVNPLRASLNYYTADEGLVSEISTTANLQSKQVFIAVSPSYATSSYSRNVYLQPLNNLYSVPSSLSLLAGQNPFPIRLSGLTSGVNYIYFSKTGDGSFYSSLPPLTLSINKNYFTPVSFVETQFRLPVASLNTNYTLGVNLPFSLYPMSEVNLTVALTTNTSGLELRSRPTVISFNPDKTAATILLYVKDATAWVLGSTVNLLITPTNTNTYASGVNISLIAVAAVISTPALTLTQGAITLMTATFGVSCSEQGRFVYHVSRRYGYNTTACSLTPSQILYWLDEKSIGSLRVNEVYYECEDVIGTVNVVTPGTAQNLLINSLKASTSYMITGFCMSQIGTLSTESTLVFSTLSNGGYVSKLDLNFGSQLSTAQKIKTVCALALLFKVSYLKVSTSDGYFCSQLLSGSRLLASQPSPASQQINQRSHKNMQFESIGQNARLLTAGSTRAQIYFGINTQLLSDTSPANINALSVSQTQIRTNLQSVVGLPSLLTISTSAASYVGANDVVSSSVYVDVGPNYLYVQGMAMPHNGLIYVIVGEDELWPRAPVISEIKKGSGPNGLPPAYFRVLAYRTGEPHSGSVAFTGLGSKKLQMYIMGSDDNPFDNANFGAIRQYTIEAETPKWEPRLLLITLTLILMWVF